MRKSVLSFFIIILVLATCILAVSCKDDEGTPIDLSYNLTFDECGGTEVPNYEGLVCDTMPIPTRDGYYFEGWYDNSSYNGRQVSFPYMAGGNATLYARWFTPAEGSPYLSFTVNSTATECTVKGYGGFAKTVVIPSTKDNVPVTTIEGGAFANCNTIESIRIPESVSQINNAFYRCSALKAIEVSEGNASYCDVDGVLFDKDKKTLLAFPSQMETYSVPEGTQTVDDYAFRQCSRLTEITLPAGLITMNKYFEGCNNLSKITVTSGNKVFRSDDGVLYNGTSLLRYPPKKQGDTFSLPAGVTSVSQYAFDGCMLKSVVISSTVTDFCNVYSDDIESFSVAAENGSYSAEEGVLFDKEKKILLQYPRNKNAESYAVPDGVETISQEAFYSVKKLKSVVISASVMKIENYAFSDNLDVGILESVSFSPYSKLSSVGDYAFMNVTSLKEIKLTSYVPPVLGEGAFSAEITSLTVYVPTKVVAVYNGTAWSGERRVITAGGDSDGFTVNYVVGDGSAVANDNTPYIGTEKTSTRGGYVFGGWYEDENYRGKRVAYPYVVTKDTTLYARWYLDEVGTSGIVYTVSADGKAFAVSGYNGSSSVVHIPATHNGIEVTSIAAKAFFGKTFIENVVLPTTIESVGEYAFGSGLAGHYMLISSINLGNTVISSIGKYAFQNCAFLDGVELPDTLTTMGNGVFEGCRSLTSVDIPDGLTSIGDYCFSDCDSLTDINADGNAIYYSDGGVLFNKDKSMLIKYPQGKSDASYVIPATVTEIASEAFLSALIAEITLPSKLQELQPRAFYSCKNLRTINTADGLTVLDLSVFRYSAVETVNVAASVSEINGDLSYLTELRGYNVAVTNSVLAS